MSVEMVTVSFCGFQHQMPKAYYDWVTHIADCCQNRWRTPYGWCYGYGQYHDFDCWCAKCSAWREEQRLHDIVDATRAQLTAEG